MNISANHFFQNTVSISIFINQTLIMGCERLMFRIFVCVLFLQLKSKVIKSEKMNLNRFPTLLFFNKQKVPIIESYEYISLPIQLEFKKRQITSLSSKIQHI